MTIKIQIDKIKHFTVSLFITILLTVLTSYTLGVAVTLTIGVIKEIFDSTQKGNKFDCMDILADLIGVLIAIILLSLGGLLK